MQTKLVDSLIKVVKDSNWSARATITEVIEEQYPEPAYPFPIIYQIRGNISTKEAIAYGSWTPDRVQDAFADVQDDYDEEEYQIACYLDFTIEANYSIKVYSFLEDSNDKHALFVREVPNLVICFTSFDVETGPVLGAMQLPENTSAVRITGLLLDENKPDRSTKQFISKAVQNRFPCFWVGDQGWNSEAVQVLCVEESAPSAYLFDANGQCVCSGSIEECVAVYELKTTAAAKSSENGGSAVADSKAWDLVKSTVGEFNVGARWRRTRVVYPPSKSAITQEVIQISGPVFEELKQSFESSVLTRYDCHRVQFVTRARKLEVAAQCSQCSNAKPKYVCLVCNTSLCSECARKHEKTDPLMILSHGSCERAIFGVGHVIKDFDATQQGDNHADVGCDCCLVAISGEDAIRFKNLAKVEHDLCQVCFIALIKAANSKDEEVDEENIEDRFNCHPKDPFCEMKSSRGVTFNRNASSSQQKQQQQIPQGHTAFSWIAPKTSSSLPPQGHTNFSWNVTTPLDI